MQRMKRISVSVLAVMAAGLWIGQAGAEAREAQYERMLADLRAEIVAAVPEVDEAKKAAYQEAREAEVAAEQKMQAARKARADSHGAYGLLNHRQNWIARAKKGVAEAQAALAEAEAMEGDAAEKEAAVAKAREALADIQENHDAAASALKLAEEAVAQAKEDEPALLAAVEATEAAHATAKARTIAAVKDLGFESLLTGDALDARLARFLVLEEAQPAQLAAFAEQGRAQARLVDRLLRDDALLVQMAVADGAREGRYGEAMEIYTAIRKVSRRARRSGVLQRLAVAIALEHAAPVEQRNARAATDAPATIDPLQRYLHYERAFTNGELDAAFEGFTVWDLRMVVDGEEPAEISDWGREMLRNYRPDHIATTDKRWRYVALVRTDIRYGSQDNKYDRDDLQFFQNILMNGGVCGRRAFMGRFILRSFGIPTTARPQRGHGALVRWTPDGWVPVLGGGWGRGWTHTRYNSDLDFLANTQGRANQERYLEVKRAQWIGSVMGEAPAYGFVSGSPGFWYGISLYRQADIHAEAEAVALAAVGEELGEANESDVVYDTTVATVKAEDQQIAVDRKGVITIPAVATSTPTDSTEKILFMDSASGGKQMHYSRTGEAEDFVYTFEVPAAGRYTLTAKVVTPSWQQNLHVSANDADPVTIALPHTVGMWDATEPVEVTLTAGINTLRFSHSSDGYPKGFSIKEFILIPE